MFKNLIHSFKQGEIEMVNYEDTLPQEKLNENDKTKKDDTNLK